MFEVIVKREFEASHALRDYRGSDEAVHSHRWLLEVRVSSPATDGSGCAIDFAEVDEALSRLLKPLAGVTLNDSPAFEGASPSAENVARHLHSGLSSALNGGKRRVTRVSVWEDDMHAASYFI